MKKKNLTIILILLSIPIVFIIVNLIIGNSFKIDTFIYDYVSKFINYDHTAFMKFITDFGGTVFILISSIIALILFKKKKDKKFLAFSLMSSVLVNQTLKFLIRRPRPTINQIVEERGFSFPSGHSMVSSLFYGFLIFLIYKNIKNKYLKYASITILLLLILTIGFSRIYLGVHYFTDVISGFILSIIELMIIINIYNKGEKDEK